MNIEITKNDLEHIDEPIADALLWLINRELESDAYNAEVDVYNAEAANCVPRVNLKEAEAKIERLIKAGDELQFAYSPENRYKAFHQWEEAKR